MRAFMIILSMLMLTGCSRESTAPVTISSDTDQDGTTNVTPRLLPASAKAPPSWYVFKIKQLLSMTENDDRTSALIEGVTMQDKTFTVKVAWDPVFKGMHRKSVEKWMKRPKVEFDAGIPYVIAGAVVSTNPLTIKPDTVTEHAPNFGAPPENVY